MKLRSTAAICVALLTACSAPASDVDTTGSDETAQVSSPSAQAEVPGSGTKRRPEKNSHNTKRNESSSEDETTPSTKQPVANKKGASGGLALPREGTYVYGQKGWEEFCQTANCDRRDLPAEQEIVVSYLDRSDSSATFESEADGGSRSQTIRYHVTDDQVAIERLTGSVTYSGFTMSQEMVPDPAIVSAIFPLEVGDSWSGSWDDRNEEMDGSYRFEVAGREKISAAGKTYSAFVLDVNMTFTGDYEGSNVMRIWVDPGKLSILSTKGKIELTSQFGTYRSSFTTYLSSNP